MLVGTKLMAAPSAEHYLFSAIGDRKAGKIIEAISDDQQALALARSTSSSVNQTFAMRRASLMLGLDYALNGDVERATATWCQSGLLTDEKIQQMGIAKPVAQIRAALNRSDFKKSFRLIGADLFPSTTSSFLNPRAFDSGDATMLRRAFNAGEDGNYSLVIGIAKRITERGWSNLIIGLAMDAQAAASDHPRKLENYYKSIETEQIESSPVAVPEYARFAALLISRDRLDPNAGDCRYSRR